VTFTIKDKVATGLLAAAVGAYVGYIAFAGIPLVHDVRGMAAVALVLGFASRRIGGAEGFTRPRVARIGAITCIALGFTALATENGVVLAVFMALTVTLWLAAMFAKSQRHDGHVRVSH
jgi:hypothetical protein